MYEYNCEVKRVVDGDTVDVVIDLGFDIHYASRVRLYGIDTPESRTRNKDEKVRGLMSKQYLIDELDYNDTQIGLVLRALDEVNCPSAEYFVNEFLLE